MQFNFIKLVNSVQTLHQPTRAQSEKILGRLEIILRRSVIEQSDCVTLGRL